jgi:50S ribosomal protein L16 3-hydroxylase
MTRNHLILAHLTDDEFLADYWQKKPLLIRNAIPDFVPPINGDDLAGLSLKPEVESRLIIGDNYQLEHGPFDEGRFQALPSNNWTLLVQAVDLWVPEVAKLREYFSFLPAWRIDDIMVSYAEDGGNVGAHKDNYDVFLLQGHGRRRWQICESHAGEATLKAATSLKLLDNFIATDEWVLNPGDMLYLPPKIAHHGVALGECTTFSIGFRAPSSTEMLDDLATELLSRDLLPRHLTDPPLTAKQSAQPISKEYIGQIKTLLLDLLDDDQTLGEWFTQFMTQPKYPSLVEMTEEKRVAVLENQSVQGTGPSYTRFINGQKVD